MVFYQLNSNEQNALVPLPRSSFSSLAGVDRGLWGTPELTVNDLESWWCLQACPDAPFMEYLFDIYGIYGVNVDKCSIYGAFGLGIKCNINGNHSRTMQL